MKKLLLVAALSSVFSFAGVCSIDKDAMVRTSTVDALIGINDRNFENSCLEECILEVQSLATSALEKAKKEKTGSFLGIKRVVESVEISYTYTGEDQTKYTGTLVIHEKSSKSL